MILHGILIHSNSMILVLTKSLLEISSDLVIDWLNHYQVEHVVLTGDELLTDSLLCFYLDNTKGEYMKIKEKNKKELDLEAIGAVWYRRRIEEASFLFYENLDLDTSGKTALIGHLKSEFLRFYSLLPVYLKDAYWLCHPDKSSLNKLATLLHARNCGLTIPETFVTNFMNFSEIKERSKTERFISKPLSETSIIADKVWRYSMLTKEVDPAVWKNKDIAFPSLIQECIEKEFEIRTFFLSGKFYSMAIFSQENEKTKTDYRNYDSENENRCVPYKLPKKVEQNISKLMRELGLNAGSVDIIKTVDGEYVFLEINPVGQFDWVSLNCNYPIEKDIALHLIYKDNHGKRGKTESTFTFAERAGE
jgi:ATP-GRASP peptide maturase of grasp-with-spasm system